MISIFLFPSILFKLTEIDGNRNILREIFVFMIKRTIPNRTAKLNVALSHFYDLIQ